MSAFLKKYFGPIYIGLITAIVIGILIGNGELKTIFDALGSLDARWVGAAAGCIIVYLFLRMVSFLLLLFEIFSYLLLYGKRIYSF